MAEREELLATDESLPPLVRKFLLQGGTLQNITLRANGSWAHEGCDFENPKITALFSRSVSRTEGGTWVLEVGRFTYPIVVEDTGFFVTHLDLSVTPARMTLSDQTEEELDVSTMTYAEEGDGGRLYCAIKGGAYKARFAKTPYYKLTDHFEADESSIYIELDGQHVTLTDLPT